MRQLGGKTRTGIPISKEVTNLIKYDVNPLPLVNYVEPFCGSLGHFKRMVEFLNHKKINMYASDGCPDVMIMWEQARKGKFKRPPRITKEIWDKLKVQKEPSALRAYVGYGHAHMGVWFKGFLGDKAHANPEFLYNDIMKMGKLFKRTTFRHCDFTKAMDGVVGRSLIYCDPPYKDTHWGYGSSFTFDSAVLYRTIDKWRKQGHTVIVSEFTYPYGRVLLDLTQPVNTRNNDKRQRTMQEKLFLV